MKTKAAKARRESGGGGVQVRRTRPRRYARRCRGCRIRAHRIEFSPDGKFLASGGHGERAPAVAGAGLQAVPQARRRGQGGRGPGVHAGREAARRRVDRRGRDGVGHGRRQAGPHPQVKGHAAASRSRPTASGSRPPAGKSVLVWDAAKGGAPATKLDYKGDRRDRRVSRGRAAGRQVRQARDDRHPLGRRRARAGHREQGQPDVRHALPRRHDAAGRGREVPRAAVGRRQRQGGARARAGRRQRRVDRLRFRPTARRS